MAMLHHLPDTAAALACSVAGTARAQGAKSPQVQLGGVMGSKAMLVVNGQPQMLAVGLSIDEEARQVANWVEKEKAPGKIFAISTGTSSPVCGSSMAVRERVRRAASAMRGPGRTSTLASSVANTHMRCSRMARMLCQPGRVDSEAALLWPIRITSGAERMALRRPTTRPSLVWGCRCPTVSPIGLG